MAKRKEISSIKSQLFSRTLSLAKTGLRTAQLAAEQAIKAKFSEQKEGAWAEYLVKQAQLLSSELGELKGSVMKVGQLISTYGEHFLPPEANAWLKSLQYQSPTLAWASIEKVLKAELEQKKIDELEIDKTALAAASIGQVHRARRKNDGAELVLKIQYPGVEGAIDSDLKFLKTILSLGPLLPKGPRFDAIFEEVRTMLYREVDYRHELMLTTRMSEYLQSDNRYKVARPQPEYSAHRVLATEYISGVAIDDPQVLRLPLEKRNFLGQAFLDLYLRELIEFKLVQTDPHFGNYRLKNLETDHPQIVLFDFGATREVPEDYLNAFMKVMEGGLLRRRELIIEGGTDLKVIMPDDPPELVQLYVELCYLITEPFADVNYDWGSSDLPKRVAIKGAEVIRKFHLRAPPRETVFLDRKLGGSFTFLSSLGCKANWRELLIEKIKLHKQFNAQSK